MYHEVKASFWCFDVHSHALNMLPTRGAQGFKNIAMAAPFPRNDTPQTILNGVLRFLWWHSEGRCMWGSLHNAQKWYRMWLHMQCRVLRPRTTTPTSLASLMVNCWYEIVKYCWLNVFNGYKPSMSQEDVLVQSIHSRRVDGDAKWWMFMLKCCIWEWMAYATTYD